MAAIIILTIEGSSTVAFLSFTKPIAMFFDGKPIFVRAMLYVILTIVPMLFDPSGFSVWFGFIISAAVTSIYAVIIIGKKGTVDDMKVVAGDGFPK